MKKVAIVGIGIGMSTLTFEAMEAINDAEVLIGAQRVLELTSGLYEGTSKRLYTCYLPKEISTAIQTEAAERFAVLVSGDVGFYSAANGLAEALPAYDLRFVPGISTVNAFFARLKLPWQDAAFASAHGHETDIVGTVRRNRLTFCLTGNNTNALGIALREAGFGHITTHIGENLGTDSERVYEATVDDFVRMAFPSMTVLLFVNEAFDDRTPCGLPDSRFSRLTGIPMTKSETRAVVMSKLNLRPASICWDIGAGTGSVTVEMALSAYRGHVYAVERRAEAIPLIDENCRSFHIGIATVICGEAPAALESLPAPDAVCIGGSGGQLDGIISFVLDKNPDARIVVTAVTLETVSSALAAFAKAGLEPEIVQMNVARSKRVSELHLMEAQNPVTILSIGGKP